MNLKKIKTIAVLGIFAISFLAHFMYDWFPCPLLSIFFPVNESIWEHMKIIFTSTLIYGIIDYLLLKKNKIKYNNFPLALYFVAFIQIPIYLAIYLPIYKLIGENLLISITLLLIVYSIGQYLSYKILKTKEYKILNKILIPFIILIYTIFTYLTYNPIHNYLFYDQIKKIYGIKK